MLIVSTLEMESIFYCAFFNINLKEKSTNEDFAAFSNFYMKSNVHDFCFMCLKTVEQTNKYFNIEYIYRGKPLKMPLIERFYYV